ncbi:hypothetical protein Hypma_011179 [Hypsizygus marmoreus]|uniref:Uncharacterized protein n=1 Tax=Hypsizygus marmoreus TaxID=39966 RepID=A0A369JK66_HYPMA|nr:hypothetical protein Hypma_011179 [Hypsizygus marmoreus]
MFRNLSVNRAFTVSTDSTSRPAASSGTLLTRFSKYINGTPKNLHSLLFVALAERVIRMYELLNLGYSEILAPRGERSYLLRSG